MGAPGLVRRPYRPALSVCPGVAEDEKWNAWLASPTGQFYLAHPYGHQDGRPVLRWTPGPVYLEPRTAKHILSTSEPHDGSSERWNTAPYREQRCSCGLSWRCDAPEIRKMFVLWADAP